MSANSFGERFRIISFGESHGIALGVVIDGCPAGVKFDQVLLQTNLDRRRPGQSASVSGRQESDQVEILSGVFENKTLGTPIAMIVRNNDAKSSDYDQIKMQARAGHADDQWKNKFGHSDHRGGGRSSGRETVSRVMAGSVAQMMNSQILPQIKVEAFCSEVGSLRFSSLVDYQNRKSEIDSYLFKLKEAGDSVGGSISLQINDVPQGLGQPVFHKFKSDMAAALLSIGATYSVDLGEASASADQTGQSFHQNTENYGGVRGGITTGEKIQMSVRFKPTSSILDVAKKGRHDPCIVIRAIPVVEAMAHLVIADHLLWMRTDRV